jgi:acetyl esterase/lipase
VIIEERLIGGVHAKVITPKSGISAAHRGRILVNFHGGAFFSGAGSEALVESIPVAGLGRFEVITVDYRQGPEYRFPAASEDAASVYQALLKHYEPHNIGMYGCSAGGILSAMAVSWFQQHHLPPPGALGIFSAGAFGSFYGPPSSPGTWGGDSRFTTPPLVGEPPLPLDPKEGPALPEYATAYLSTADLTDPLISPALSPSVLSKFPPTLLITGTRAYDMSAAVQTHRALTRVGVSADLHVWDGMGHCFFFDVELPESREAYSVMVKFFSMRLGR